MFGKFLRRFGDFIQGGGQRLDIFPLQSRDKCIDQLFADLLGDALLLAPGQHKILQRRRGGGTLDDAHQSLHAAARFLGARFQQVEKLVAFAKQLLQGKHNAAFGNTTVADETRRILGLRRRIRAALKSNASAGKTLTLIAGISPLLVVENQNVEVRMTSLPSTVRLRSAAKASGVSASGNTRLTTGRNLPEATHSKVRSRSARLRP